MDGSAMRVIISACLSFGGAGATLMSSAQAQIVAAETPPANIRQTALVTLTMKDASLEAVLRTIARQAGLDFYYQRNDIVLTRRVSIDLHKVRVDDALINALEGTGLKAVISARAVLLTKDGALTLAAPGSIYGKVVDEARKQPIRGATVLLDDALRGVQTNDDGAFQMTNVNVGAHRITVRLLGYLKQVKTVNVQDGQTTATEFVLVPSASTLEQVVVTGTIIPTERKAVPNAITVVTAKQIEERGVTRIDQLFRGDIPGLFAQNRGSEMLLDQVVMYSRGATALSNFSAGTSFKSGIFFSTNPIKTYVDGVELADPQYLSQIDPKSIERIEILTGPQASTIYGSNAINGVMQIFTKRETTSHPQLTLNLLSGWVENNFSSAHTPQHDYSAQLSGIEGRFSYNAGGVWNYIGPWTPAKQTTRLSTFGGTRLVFPTILGSVTADVSIRRTNTQNQQHGDAGQALTQYLQTGWYSVTGGGAGLSSPTTYMLSGQTLGLALGYAPVSWWSWDLGAGQDELNTEMHTVRGYLYTPADTALQLEQTHSDRRSFHVATSARIPIATTVYVMMTLGVDAWKTLASSFSASPQTLTGSLTSVNSISRQPDHNTGGFLQTQLGLKDRIFFTYGLRAEWNPAFGKDALPNYAPRYGVAYTQDIGLVTTKVRGSYGRSTRPPQSTFRNAQKASNFGFSARTLSEYGNWDFYIANPELGPEYQQGWEGGLELYLGTHGSLVVTRYNQTVDGLIDRPKVDSVRSIVINPNGGFCCDLDGYGYQNQFEYLNIGSLRNQGWELQGSANAGPFTTRGTYSWTKSRVIGVTPKYRAFFTPSGYPQYQPGASFQYLPEHTWAWGISYTRTALTLGINVTGIGQTTIGEDAQFLKYLVRNIRLQQNRAMLRTGNNYISHNREYTLMDVTGSRRLTTYLDGVVQIQNLENRYVNDYDAVNATIGRQVRLGGKVRLQ